MHITYKWTSIQEIPSVFKFEPHIAGVKVTDTDNFVIVTHEIEPAINISIGKHLYQPEERATICWSTPKSLGAGEVEFADKFHHCLETAIMIASLINAHFKVGKHV